MKLTSNCLAVSHREPFQVWEQLIRNCAGCLHDNSLKAMVSRCGDSKQLLARSLFGSANHGATNAVDLIELVQEIQSELQELLEAKQINLGIDGQCHQKSTLPRDRLHLAMFAIVLEAIVQSPSSSDIELSIDQYERYLEMEVADASDRRVSDNVLPASVWSVRCAAHLLAQTPFEFEVNNCPQGGIAIRIKQDAHPTRMAA